MAHMNVFQDEMFGLVSLTELVEEVPYKPRRLGELGLFREMPINTEEFSIENVAGRLQIIQSTERGEAPNVKTQRGARDVRQFRTIRLAQSDRLTAKAIAGIRAAGTEAELEAVAEHLHKMIGNAEGDEGLLADLELTRELHRLGALQGLVLDADGSTLYDWFSHFGITQDPFFNFNWPASVADEGQVKVICNQIRRQMFYRGKGAVMNGVGIHALCGNDFYDALTSNKETRNAYLQQGAIGDLIDGFGPWEAFRYGNIIWENYQGSEDETTVAIDPDQAVIFPTGTNMFKQVLSPADEFIEYVNTPGRPEYLMQETEQRENPRHVDVELYAYNAHVPTRPGMLQRAQTQP